MRCGGAAERQYAGVSRGGRPCSRTACRPFGCRSHDVSFGSCRCLLLPFAERGPLCPRFAFYPAESADGFAASSRCGCGNLPCSPVHSADIEHPRSGAVRRTGKSMPRIKRCGGAEASVRTCGRRRAGKVTAAPPRRSAKAHYHACPGGVGQSFV